MLRILCLSLILHLFLSTSGVSSDFDHDHNIWHSLLQKNVKILQEGQITQVDYEAFLRNREELTSYLSQLSDVKKEIFDGWSLDNQLAFLINAYNSWTIELILTKYPDLKSIKDLGSFFSSPWKKEFISLFEETISLDDIEHGLIRGSNRYNDPRIHFAVNCASIGCPALRPEPYVGQRLQTQLEEAMTLFLLDQTRNRYTGSRLEVSAIFKWYRKDFEKGHRNFTSLEQFFASQKRQFDFSENQVKQLLTGEMKIHFLSYDWDLNKVE